LFFKFIGFFLFYCSLFSLSFHRRYYSFRLAGSQHCSGNAQVVMVADRRPIVQERFLPPKPEIFQQIHGQTPQNSGFWAIFIESIDFIKCISNFNIKFVQFYRFIEISINL